MVADRPMGPCSFWLEAAPKGAQSHLVIYPKAMLKGSENMKASIVFQGDDVRSTYEKLKANGVEFPGEPQEMQRGTFVQF